MDLSVQVQMVALVVAAIGFGFLIALLVSRHWNRIRAFAGRAGFLLGRYPPYEIWPQPIVVVNPNGTIRRLNQAASDLFGYDEDALRGQPVSCLIRGAAFRNGPRARDSRAPVLPSDSGITAEGIRRDGEVFPVRCVALGRSFLLVNDESEGARLSEIHGRVELLTSAFQMNPVPLLIVDRDRRVIAANRASEAVFGSPVREGAHLNELFPGAEIHEASRFRLKHIRSGYAFTAPPGQIGLGQGNLVLCGFRDSAKRRLEDLLTEMTAYSELLLSETPADSMIREDLELMHAASQEAIAVVRALGGPV